MTIELYRNDPYCAEFDAQVLGRGPDYIVLDQTCFFPRSADQATDVGLIETIDVQAVRRIGSEIRHFVNDSASFAVGDRVRCSLDWERRYRTMRLHTAQHLIGIGFEQTHDAWTTLGGAIGPHRATLSFSASSDADPPELRAVQAWIDATIRDSLVAVHEVDGSLDERRYWHIDGLATLACDGTHVRSTNEVGAIFLELSERRGDIIELCAGLIAS